jgi:uncharacterized membrane protein
MEGLLGLLPFAVVALLCPLMMIFMMRGMHGGHDEHAERAEQSRAPSADDERAAARLQAMEEEMTELRREIAAAKGVEEPAISRNGGRA